jgi:hypothetical protein
MTFYANSHLIAVTKHYYAVKLVSMEQDFGAVNNELAILGRVKHPFVIRLEEVFRSATKVKIKKVLKYFF